MSIKLINLTPHALTIVSGGNRQQLLASGVIARVSETTESVGSMMIEIGGAIVPVEMRRKVMGSVEGLPEPVEGSLFVVSAMVRSALVGRPDVITLDTGKSAVRDAKGQIEAVTGLIVSA